MDENNTQPIQAVDDSTQSIIASSASEPKKPFWRRTHTRLIVGITVLVMGTTAAALYIFFASQGDNGQSRDVPEEIKIQHLVEMRTTSVRLISYDADAGKIQAEVNGEKREFTLPKDIKASKGKLAEPVEISDIPIGSKISLYHDSGGRVQSVWLSE